MNTQANSLLIEYQPTNYQGFYVLVREESNYMDQNVMEESIAKQRGCIIENIKPLNSQIII